LQNQGNIIGETNCGINEFRERRQRRISKSI